MVRRANPPDVLKGILCVGLFAIASSFLRSPESATVKLLDQDIEAHHQKAAQTCITTNAGETICYTIDNRTEGRLLIGIGGLFLGMVSTGLGELNGYFLLQRCHVPSKIAVATSVFIVAITALIASIGHAIQFIQQGGDALNTVLSLVIFTAPGVIIGLSNWFCCRQPNAAKTFRARYGSIICFSRDSGFS